MRAHVQPYRLPAAVMLLNTVVLLTCWKTGAHVAANLKVCCVYPRTVLGVLEAHQPELIEIF